MLNMHISNSLYIPSNLHQLTLLLRCPSGIRHAAASLLYRCGDVSVHLEGAQQALSRGTLPVPHRGEAQVIVRLLQQSAAVLAGDAAEPAHAKGASYAQVCAAVNQPLSHAFLQL